MRGCYIFLTVVFQIYLGSAFLSDYVNKISHYLGYKAENAEGKNLIDDSSVEKIPYEVSLTDEKFISEAVKLTGVSLSELDSCQQRVVLKLKVECHKMNDEQLAKMAVYLLNCQSYVEGRRIYPCTEEMGIKECTMDMDSDTWTSYHLMSNRARAVCYTIRQTQFRGLAEHTVNRLMEASRDQLISLGKIAHNQENIRELAENTYETVSRAQDQLSGQQKDMQRAQFHSQLILENNIMKLVDGKKIIEDTHNKLIEMTHQVYYRLENSINMIEKQSRDSEYSHKELLEDIELLRSKAEELFTKTDEYSEILFKQNEDFKHQFESTLQNLQEVNRTVNSLLSLVGGTRHALEDRLSWILTALGGTDQAGNILFVIVWHVSFTLIAMVISAFLSANVISRFIVVSLPSLNLAMALHGIHHFDSITLMGLISTLIGVQLLITSIIKYYKKKKISNAIPWSKQDVSIVAKKSLAASHYKTNNSKLGSNHLESNFCDEQKDEFSEDFSSLTPPVSRNGYYSSIRSRSRSSTPFLLTSPKGSCGARTRAGTPCKLSSVSGRDFCYRHQNGDSVMG